MTKLKVGVKAPDFKLPNQKGNICKLSDYKGAWLLLYFYPKDNTPGCTTEACSFRDNYEKLKEKVEIVGVSRDSVKSHANFSGKYKLPFTILADPQKEVIKRYQTNGLIFAKRTSFLINPQGVIEKIYEKVNPGTHVSEIEADLSSKI